MTTDLERLTTGYRRGPHWWAVLTVCAALPLVTLGAEVTTRQVGMVDQVGFRTPWHMLEVPLREKGLGFVIEHSHRLAGFVVGTCAIVLAVWVWLSPPRRSLRWLGVLALAGVSAQGLLGGFRVSLDRLFGRDLALVHGVFGQVVFSLLVGVALVTSRSWSQPAEPEAPDDSPRARRTAWFALLVTGLVLAQLVFGAILRHRGSPLGQRAHLLLAFAVAGGAVWLLRLASDGTSRDRRLAGATRLLVLLVAVQVVLGVEAWMIRFGGEAWRSGLVRTAHVLVGSLILATSAAATLEAFRRAAPAARPAAEPVGQLEGAL